MFFYPLGSNSGGKMVLDTFLGKTPGFSVD